MDNTETKICPFNCKPCMKDECVLFGGLADECVFKELDCFIGDCFSDLRNELIKTIEDKKHD